MSSVVFSHQTEGHFTPWRMVLFNARLQRDAWLQVLAGAERVYTAYKVGHFAHAAREAAEQFETWIACAEIGERVVGGMRVHRATADGDLPLLTDLGGHIDTQPLRESILERLDEGVLHAGGLWVDPEFRKTAVASDAARAHLVMGHLTGSRWLVGVCDVRLVDAWQSVGYRVDERTGGFPYPDSRYRSYIVWCDLTNLPEPESTWVCSQRVAGGLNGRRTRLELAPMRLPAKEHETASSD